MSIINIYKVHLGSSSMQRNINTEPLPPPLPNRMAYPFVYTAHLCEPRNIKIHGKNMNISRWTGQIDRYGEEKGRDESHGIIGTLQRIQNGESKKRPYCRGCFSTAMSVNKILASVVITTHTHTKHSTYYPAECIEYARYPVLMPNTKLSSQKQASTSAIFASNVKDTGRNKFN